MVRGDESPYPAVGSHGAALFRLGRTCRGAWWAIAAASLWLRSGFPIHAVGHAGLDDALFIRLARNLGAGLWLGAFDNTTLVKGMFYPLFILLSFAAGIPLKLAEQGVYLAASAYVALLVARAYGGRWAGTALFAALAFNPVLWTVGLSRVIREGLYISLSLAVVGLAVAVAVPGPSSRRARWLLGVSLGLVAGGFWLTREEGVWLAPAVALILLMGFAGTLGRAAPARFLAASGVPLVLAALGFTAVVGANMAMNRMVYGIAETVEVKSPAFGHAYGAISRIAHQNWQRYVVFPKDARDLAYRVSPAARELQPYFDGAPSQIWVETGCTASPMPACSEIQASWFQWALRDAVKDAGHYTSLPEAARFYEQLAREIDDACDRQAIPCLPQRSGLMPPFRWHYIADAVPAAVNLARMLFRPGGEEIQRLPSVGLNLAVDLFAETAGPVGRGTSAWSIVEGWMGARDGAPLLTLRPPSGPGAPIRSELTVAAGAAPPAGPAFPLLQVRLATDCPPEACEVVLSAGDRTVNLGKIAGMAALPPVDQPDLYFRVSGAAGHIALQGQERRNALIERIARVVARAYAAATPFLSVIGAIGLLATLLARRSACLRAPLVILGLASAVAVASRVALLAYLDVTSIQSQNMLYASPASPFVILFAVCGILMLADLSPGAIRRRWEARPPTA